MVSGAVVRRDTEGLNMRDGAHSIRRLWVVTSSHRTGEREGIALNIFRADLSLRKKVQPLGRTIAFEH